MKEISLLLNRMPLFAGIKPENLPAMLSCLGAKRSGYRRQDIILLEGQPVPAVGIVLSGSLQIVKEDYRGNRNILAELAPGSLFAESYACVQAKSLPVTVLSVTGSEVLWIDYARIVNTCPSACRFHSRLIENMLKIVAAKNIALSRKIEHISQRTTREKILFYLSDEAAKAGKNEFDIPFSRQEMADYLCVDRSALSGELGRLSGEGVLTFRRNHFRLNAEGNERRDPEGCRHAK